jgi:hypothetical protein
MNLFKEDAIRFQGTAKVRSLFIHNTLFPCGNMTID